MIKALLCAKKDRIPEENEFWHDGFRLRGGWFYAEHTV